MEVAMMDVTQRFIQEHRDTIICQPSGLTLAELKEAYIQKIRLL